MSTPEIDTTTIQETVQEPNQNDDPTQVVYPPHIQKFQDKMDFMKQRLLSNKKEADDTLNDFKQLERAFEKAIKKMVKKSSKPKKPRKPSGFALPVPVSTELCEFMGLEPGTHIPRTDVTKRLMTYIAENKLQNPEKKSIIIPNEPLLRILGDEVKDVLLTHFTIQKYINKHFLKRQPVNEVVTGAGASAQV
jgi:chromatin remodeling complex protein RSC6